MAIVLDDIVRSAAQQLDAPIQTDAGCWFVDVWVFLDPHDAAGGARRQIVQLFEGEAGDRLYLASTVGPYEPALDLAPLLRAMVGALRCSLYLASPDAEGVEHLKVGSAVETRGLDPEHLAARLREVAVFADRFEAALYGRETDLR